MRELALFAGAGGGVLGGILLGWRTVCAVEIDAYCRSVLLARQRDGILAPFPIWDDVRTFDGRPWEGSVDVISGGFPCQDISAAGGGVGLDGARSGLWSEFARIIREVRPRCVFVENSPMLTVRGLGRVLGDLAGMGFNARWGVFSACSVGAPHVRRRLFVVADADSIDGRSRIRDPVARQNGPLQAVDSATSARVGWEARLADPSALYRDANGVADGMDRNHAIGNGQVPSVVRLAFETLSRVL